MIDSTSSEEDTAAHLVVRVSVRPPYKRANDPGTGQAVYYGLSGERRYEEPEEWDEFLGSRAGLVQEVTVKSGASVAEALRGAGLQDPDSRVGCRYWLRPRPRTLKKLSAKGLPADVKPLPASCVVDTSSYARSCAAAGIRPTFLIEKAVARRLDLQFFLPGGGSKKMKVPPAQTIAELGKHLHELAVAAAKQTGEQFLPVQECDLKVCHLKLYGNRGYTGPLLMPLAELLTIVRDDGNDAESTSYRRVRECPIARFCLREEMPMKLTLVERAVDASRTRLMRESEVERLVGGQRVSALARTVPEVREFQRVHRSLRLKGEAVGEPPSRHRRAAGGKTRSRSKGAAGGGGGPSLEVGGAAQNTIDLGPPPRYLKRDKWFEAEFTFVTMDELGTLSDSGESFVQLCDHGMRMSQLLEDLGCDSLTAPHEWIAKPRGSSEWLAGDLVLIEYPYIRNQMERKLPVSLQIFPRQPVVKGELAQLGAETRLETAVQAQIDTEHARADQPEPEITMDPDLPRSQWTCLPIWHLPSDFSFTVSHCSDVVLPEHVVAALKKAGKSKAGASEPGLLYVQASLTHGGKNFQIDELTTGSVPASHEPHWTAEPATAGPGGGLVVGSSLWLKLPRATVLSLTLMHATGRKAPPPTAPMAAAPAVADGGEGGEAVPPPPMTAMDDATAGDPAAPPPPPPVGAGSGDGAAGTGGGGGGKEGFEGALPVAWVNMHVFDHHGVLIKGRQALKLWPSLDKDDLANPIGTCVQNQAEDGGESPPMLLHVDFPTHEEVNPEGFEICKYTWGADNDDSHDEAAQPRPRQDEAEHLARLTDADPLTQPTDEEKALLYKFRHRLKGEPRALAKVMLGINPMLPDQIREARRLLKVWAPLTPTQALDLLEARHADLRVREHAVGSLERLSDTELELYMPQLIQTLKYDPYHNSALSQFLMRRALRCPTYIGHLFFWSLKAETHLPEIRERYSLLIDEFLRGCGLYRKSLTTQHWLMNKLEVIAERIKPLKDSERLGVLRRDLAALNHELPLQFVLPLDPTRQLRRLKVEKCKYMDSKKLPLWLVFESCDPHADDYYVIFKVGDDLRQDVLTLQMLKIMDRLWKAEGLDMKMNVYGCISTGDEVGLVEVVLNSETMANISKQAGGALAELTDSSVFTEWLRDQNRNEAQFQGAVETFILSTAAYCVATYVLGIGDRHNDNVMMTRTGEMFHIDFGHFLGNFKSKYGFKRERAPFVFTPQYAHVMGGAGTEQFEHFVDCCGHAYNIVRKHGHLLLVLFTLMLSTGIPELRELEDIDYMRQMLSLEMTDEQAAAKFEALIHECMKSKATRFNNVVHILAH